MQDLTGALGETVSNDPIVEELMRNTLTSIKCSSTLSAVFVLLLVVCFPQQEAFSEVNEQSAITFDRVPTVDFCELASNVDFYVGKMVRVKAVFVSTFDWRALYHPRCHKKRIRPELFCDTVSACTAKAAPLNRELRNGSYATRVALTVVGQLRTRNKQQAALDGLELSLEIYHIDDARRLSGRVRRRNNRLR